MPKPKGKKNKNISTETKRPLEIKGPMEEYGKIMKMLGSGQVRIILSDSREIFGRIAGRFKRRGRRRVWMNPGDIVLLSYRSFQDTVYDVVYLYNPDEVKTLINKDEIPPFFAEVTATKDVQDVIDFDDSVSEQPHMTLYNDQDMEYKSDDSSIEYNTEDVDEFGNIL